jgi:hypothetical protein
MNDAADHSRDGGPRLTNKDSRYCEILQVCSPLALSPCFRLYDSSSRRHCNTLNKRVNLLAAIKFRIDMKCIKRHCDEKTARQACDCLLGAKEDQSATTASEAH